MRIVAGILILISGVICPLAMLFLLNRWLSRQPRPRPGQTGLLLALNGVLPLGLVTLGLGLLSPKLWALAWLQTVTAAAWLATIVILVALAVSGRTASQRGRDGR